VKGNTKNFHNHHHKLLFIVAIYYHQVSNHDTLAYRIEASLTKLIKMDFVDSVGNFLLFDFKFL